MSPLRGFTDSNVFGVNLSKNEGIFVEGVTFYLVSSSLKEVIGGPDGRFRQVKYWCSKVAYESLIWIDSLVPLLVLPCDQSSNYLGGSTQADCGRTVAWNVNVFEINTGVDCGEKVVQAVWTMSKVPGSTGHVILGDKSLDFGKCPLDFVERLSSQYKSPIFMTRLLLKPTVIVASNSAIRELLYEKEDHFDRGLREQCLQLFGDNVLLVDGEDAQRFRDILKPLLHPDCILNYKEKALSVFHHWSNTLPTGQPIDMYKEFKQLGMNLTLRIFLDIDSEISSKLAEDVLALSTTHWHGLISVPINVKVPLVLSSAYRRAMDAKEQLLTIISDKMDAQNSGFVEELRSHCDDVEFVQSHLLLFISALIPKAVASILSSFLASSSFWLEAYMAERSVDGQEITSFSLYHIMMEVCRLWPPFVGGYRVANRDTTLGGYLIEKGRTVLYVCAPAHREPDLFPRPDEFDPLRWTTCNVGDEDKMFTFGGGSRGCLGKNMILDILMVIAEAFIAKFDWDIVGSSPGILGFSLSNSSSGSSSPIKMKSLPITRPKAPLELILTRKDEENGPQDLESSRGYCARSLCPQMSWDGRDFGNTPS